MNYTITKNPQFNSLEIIFDGMPSKEVRDALKSLKFRWHSVKKLWYGYGEEEKVKNLLDCPKNALKKEVKQKVNSLGVKVGDIFHCSWGYDQTNNSFLQVIDLVGEKSVKVVEVDLHYSVVNAYSMAEDRLYTTEVREERPRGLWIKDQKNGDTKRVKEGYYKDQNGKPIPQITLENHYTFTPFQDSVLYESWYA